MIFRFADSHAYPGCGVTLAPATGDDMAEFADGSAAPAHWEPDAVSDGYVVDLGAYRTARGTDIAAKRWRVGRADSGWKVTAALSPSDA